MHGIDSGEERNVLNRLGGALSDRTAFSQVGFTLGITLIVYFIASGLSALLITNIYGVSGSEMIKDVERFLENNGNNLNAYRFMQIMSTIVIFGFSSIIMSFLITGKGLGYFRFERRISRNSMLLVPVIMLLVFPVITLVYSYTSRIPVPEELAQLEKSLEVFTMGLLGDPSIGIFMINFLMIAILPAVFEEMLFRGVLMKQLTKVSGSHHIGILLSGIIFGLIHGQVFKFLPIAVLGILLGYLYWWTKNLWFPIAAHFFHNGIQVIAYFLVARGVLNIDLESNEMLPALPTALLTVLFAAIIYLFYNVNRKTADEPI